MGKILKSTSADPNFADSIFFCFAISSEPAAYIIFGLGTVYLGGPMLHWIWTNTVVGALMVAYKDNAVVQQNRLATLLLPTLPTWPWVKILSIFEFVIGAKME